MEVTDEPEENKEIPLDTSAKDSALDSLLAKFSKPAIEKQEESEETEAAQQEQTTEEETPVAEEKKKRGRKPGTKNKTIEETEAGEVVIDSDLISGATFLMFIDFIIPNVFCYFGNRGRKKGQRKMEPEDMELTEKQLKKLEPMAEKTIDQLKLKGNPAVIFAIMMLGSYGITYAKVKATLDE